MLAQSVTETNTSSLKTDKCMTAIPTYSAVNQNSEYKDAHYVGIAVIHLSVFRLYCYLFPRQSELAL